MRSGAIDRSDQSARSIRREDEIRRSNQGQRQIGAIGVRSSKSRSGASIDQIKHRSQDQERRSIDQRRASDQRIAQEIGKDHRSKARRSRQDRSEIDQERQIRSIRMNQTRRSKSDEGASDHRQIKGASIRSKHVLRRQRIIRSDQGKSIIRSNRSGDRSIRIRRDQLDRSDQIIRIRSAHHRDRSGASDRSGDRSIRRSKIRRRSNRKK
ncbi:arginine/serine-rich coiled-coil protein 2-like [Xenia sp. Carnegie-2017]|uniref:arginine/serine-rich coiled-coil protein 2-like n=1 Tax=Xenia sp. Carnegie-2017 TaxID=2897299 RepID=UPI001F04FF50|nr:arginine/serine-rich coiled-coil protein 2-like [Xenia sp. Carnegie-2017]